MIPLRVVGSPFVLEGDPVAVRACGDIADPILIVQIPADRLAQARVETLARRPAEVAPDLAGVDRVAPVVARPILHEGDLPRIGTPVATWALVVQYCADPADQ